MHAASHDGALQRSQVGLRATFGHPTEYIDPSDILHAPVRAASRDDAL